MNRLIQLIGPQMSGKTELRRRVCPDAVMFDKDLDHDKANAYYLDWVPSSEELRVIENLLASERDIAIIYEGYTPLLGIERTMIWEIKPVV